MASTEIVSWSEINAYRDCPKKWAFQYRDRWETERSGPALERGIQWHEIMELHYRGIQALQNTGELDAVVPFNTAINDLLGRNDPAGQTEQQQLLDWMYSGYLEHWPIEEEVRSWRILSVEHAAEMWLPTDRGGRSRFRLKMKIDLVVKIGQRIWIVDHKTCKDLPNAKTLELDDQFGLYCWGLRRLGFKVHGALYNAARTYRYVDPKKPQPLEERFVRPLLYRTDRELEEIAVEAYYTAKASRTNPVGRTPDTDMCRRKCSFMEPCLAGRKGIDERELLIAKGYVQRRDRH